jgi:hypothetical protein
MDKRIGRLLAGAAILGMLSGAPAAADESGAGHGAGHRTMAGKVIEKGGKLVVQTPDGATYQLSDVQSKKHGHAPHKAGDEVTVVFDENNLVSEIHPKGQGGNHRFVTGKLVHVGKMRGEIKVQTPDGEETFPLDRQELKTKPLEDGAPVTVEVNEAGRVVDIHRTGEGQGKR